MSGPTKFEQVVGVMIQFRDQLAEEKRLYEEKTAALREKLEKGEAWLLDQINNAGVNSMKCPAGTVYISETMAVTAADKAGFAEFVRNTGEIELLEMRPSKSAIKEYMDRNGGALPPGITTRTERSLNIRRASGK